MRIVLGETPDFRNYTVTRAFGPGWLAWLGLRRPLRGVLLADDQTGEVVRQEYTREGHPLYVNADGDAVALDGYLKVLLLAEAHRTAFLAEFRPRTVTEWHRDVRIERSGQPSVAAPSPMPQSLQMRQDGEQTVVSGMY